MAVNSQYQTFLHHQDTYRGILSKMNARFLEDLCALSIHVVALAENDLSNADLDDLDATCQTGTTEGVSTSNCG